MTPLRRIRATDRRAERALQPTRRSAVLGAATAAVSIAGDPALVLVAAARLRRGSRPSGYALAGTLVTERVVTGMGKRYEHRSRPPERFRPRVSLHPRTAGFPSGHTSLGFLAAAVQEFPQERWVPSVAAGLVALSRLHQGLHRPSDLLAGAGLGLAGGHLARTLGHDRPVTSAAR